MIDTLTTERLVLRRPRMDDAERLAKLLNNFGVSGNLSRVPYPYTAEHARAWIGACHRGGNPNATSFVIDLEDEGAVGVIGNEPRPVACEIGYWLGEPYWGHGIMTEAIEAVLDWYFANTRSDFLSSGVFHFNMASLAIQQKLGFVETGRSVMLCMARGQEVERIDTELTRDAYEAYRTRQPGQDSEHALRERGNIKTGS